MVIPVNTMTAGEALNLATMASQRSAQTFQTNIDSLQKIRENREWASEEQKAMRKSKVRAETATANKTATVDELETDWINNNVDVYQDAVASGVYSKSVENWSKVSEAEADAFFRYGGGLDLGDPEQAEAFIKNMARDPVGRRMIPGLPNISSIREGDPQALNALKVLQGSLYQDVKHRQALAQSTQEGEIRAGLQQQQGAIDVGLTNLRGNIESRHIGERTSGSLLLQGQDQGFRAGQAERGFAHNIDLQERAHEQRLKLEELKHQYDIELANIKKIAERGKDSKISDILGSNTDLWIKNTLPKVASIVAAERGIVLPEGDASQLAAEVGTQVVAAYQSGVSDNPSQMAEDLTRWMFSSGKVAKKSLLGVEYGLKPIDTQEALFESTARAITGSNKSTAAQLDMIKKANRDLETNATYRALPSNKKQEALVSYIQQLRSQGNP